MVTEHDLIQVWRQAIFAHTPGRRENFSQALRLHEQRLLQIWQTYTQNRRDLGRLPTTQMPFVAPYLLGFHLSNVTRVQAVLERALARGLPRPTLDKIRVVDIGCGSGAASQGVISALQQVDTQWTFELLDRSRPLVNCARQMLSELHAQFRVRSLVAPLDKAPLSALWKKWKSEGPVHTILCFGFVWNEIQAHPKTQNQVERFLNAVLADSQPAWIVIAEPATEASARRMMALRDRWTSQGWIPVYPCPQAGRCPMTATGRDWCYSEITYSPPKEFAQVAKALHISRRELGVAGYVFAHPSIKVNSRSQPVIVGHPRLSPRQHDLLLCHGTHLSREAGSDQPLRGTEFKKNRP